MKFGVKNTIILLFIFFTFPVKSQTNVAQEFNSLNYYYYDIENKIPFSSKVSREGAFVVYFIPNNSALKQFYINILKNNDIKIKIDETNDLKYLSKIDENKINTLIKNKIVNNFSSYYIIGTYLASQYIIIDPDNPEEYSVLEPSIMEYYKKDFEKWILIKREKSGLGNLGQNVSIDFTDYLKQIYLRNNSLVPRRKFQNCESKR